MNNSRSTEIKGKLYRITLALLVMLSFFTVSGLTGLSSYLPQKASTELLFNKTRNAIPLTGYYYHVRINRDINPKYHYKLQQQEQYAVMIYNNQIIIRLNHLFCEFIKIKPAVLLQHCLGNLLKLQDETLTA